MANKKNNKIKSNKTSKKVNKLSRNTIIMKILVVLGVIMFWFILFNELFLYRT